MFKKIMLFLALAVGMLSTEPYFKTDTEATKKATELGYVKIKEISNGQAVYEKTKKSRVVIAQVDYISRDVDGHNGGAWKGAIKVAKLGKRETRSGTYNADLSKRIGD
jgi:hypothetical protein